MRLKDDSVFEYGTEYSGRMLKDVPCSYLLGLYNQAYDLPKNLENWLEENLNDLEEAAGVGEKETLSSVFEE